MTCAGCRWAEARQDLAPRLVCRRYPPMPLAAAVGPMVAGFPVVEADGWCGEHTPVRAPRLRRA